MNLEELFDHPSKWTKGASARDRLGDPLSQEAVSWCLVGGIVKCNCEEQMQDLANIIGGKDMPSLLYWNDKPGRTFKEVKRVIHESVRATHTRELDTIPRGIGLQRQSRESTLV